MKAVQTEVDAMIPYKQILLATDFSEQARKAAAEAVRIARRYQAQLHVLHVDVIALQNTDGFDHPPLADYVRSFDQVAMDAVGLDVGVSYRNAVTAIIRDTSEAAGILRYAAEKDIDLIVLGTHGRSPLGEAFMGSVAQRVVRESAVSVLIVGPHQKSGGAPAGGKHVILAPVDLTARSGFAMAQAGALASERSAHLLVLHALDFSRVAHDESMSREQEQEEAHDRLDQFVARAGLPVDAEPVLGVGPAADVIFDIARKREAELIVIAPSGHGPIDRVLLGSVTKRVVRGASCPVLIHREPVEARERVAA